jgi:glycosyltransferase involved in cell wall biosynthesis
VKVSIVTISYNQGKFIEETINSVLSQSDVEIEYIVVDAGSTDGSRDIINKYADRIHKIIFEPDKGPADGLNKGFAHATGDILGYLNADDILLPGALRQVSDFFETNKDVHVVSGHCYIVDEKGNRLHKKFSNKLTRSSFSNKRYAIGYSILVQQSTFFKKELFDAVNGFDIDFKVMWDAALTVDFIRAKAQFKVVNAYWSCFRVYPGSISGSGTQASERGKLEYQMLQKRLGYINTVPAWQYPYYWLVGWLLEPIHLIRRIINGIQSPKRII